MPTIASIQRHRIDHEGAMTLGRSPAASEAAIRRDLVEAGLLLVGEDGRVHWPERIGEPDEWLIPIYESERRIAERTIAAAGGIVVWPKDRT